MRTAVRCWTSAAGTLGVGDQGRGLRGHRCGTARVRGHRALRRHAADGERGRVPVVVLTARTTSGDRIQERTIGSPVKKVRHKLGDLEPEVVVTVGYRLRWACDPCVPSVALPRPCAPAFTGLLVTP
ncbi:hypothetical protein [Streptomyces sp. NPDC048385]|uniref:hypothetical protein n=1 Tax=unclassified Streptomyces TaxID=2593676 RepID=UPI003420B6CB